MDSENFRDKIHEVTIDGKEYALIPLCLFHDIAGDLRHDVVANQFGLMDTYASKSLYEITDRKKLMMLKIKYGV
jgi:hypothetical protein